jgi:hypothetical protein
VLCAFLKQSEDKHSNYAKGAAGQSGQQPRPLRCSWPPAVLKHHLAWRCSRVCLKPSQAHEKQGSSVWIPHLERGSER